MAMPSLKRLTCAGQRLQVVALDPGGAVVHGPRRRRRRPRGTAPGSCTPGSLPLPICCCSSANGPAAFDDDTHPAAASPRATSRIAGQLGPPQVRVQHWHASATSTRRRPAPTASLSAVCGAPFSAACGSTCSTPDARASFGGKSKISSVGLEGRARATGPQQAQHASRPHRHTRYSPSDCPSIRPAWLSIGKCTPATVRLIDVRSASRCRLIANASCRGAGAAPAGARP